ncbi:MAG: UDP-2,3-diacylglucosamine diphosphatase [Planctomycetota bacterium]
MKTHYRSVWISDTHLCSRDSQAEMLHNFLDSIKVDQLYLVGDIIDVWALRKRWYWPAQYNEVVHKLLKRSRRGAHVIYVPGNHDEFFRAFVGYRFGEVEIQEDAIHEMADGRRFLVIHGDVFDNIIRFHKWLSLLGGWAYAHLVTVNRIVNTIRKRCGKPYWSLAGATKRRVKHAIDFLSRFEETLVSEARRRGVDGVICGHVHQPVIREMDGLTYCNTGDWVENCTALVETFEGELKLVWWHQEVDARCAPREAALAG